MKMHYTSLVFAAFCLFWQVTAQDFAEHTIANGYNSWSAVAIDVDGDGDTDIVGSSRLNSKVSWWENDGDENFTLHPISTNAAYAMGICAADLDSDGDIDVICAVQQANAVRWWENNGEEGFTQQLLADILSPSYIDTCDLDQDNDLDILVAACEDGSNKIAWFENIDNTNFTTHVIRENWDHANCVHSADMDGDGDIDVLATASFRTHPNANGEIAWFENDGNQNFTGHTVISDYGRPGCAVAVDIDNDMDKDIVASVCLLNQVVLFRNNSDLTFTPVVIDSSFNRPHTVFTADLDNDLDIDILGSSIDGNQLAWWENDTSGFIKHVISYSFGGATCINADDIDDDGDMDVLGTAQYENQITWWENSLVIGLNDQENDPKLPAILHQNFPNPFSTATFIRYEVEIPCEVDVMIHDVVGSEVASLADQKMNAGEYLITFDGTSLTGGFYIFSLVVNEQLCDSKKMLLIR